MYKFVKIIAILLGIFRLNGQELEVENSLLNKGANMGIKNDDGKTLLSSVEESEILEIIEAWETIRLVEEWPPSDTERLTSPNVNELKKKLLLAKGKYGQTAWHKVASEGNLESLETIWRVAKEVELTADELLLARNEEGETAMHLAAQGNHVRVLEKLWDWAEEDQINGNEITKKLFLAKDKYGKTAWQNAAAKGNIESLETIWRWVKEAELNPDELLQDQDKDGLTAFHLAVEGNKVEMLQKQWVRV